MAKPCCRARTIAELGNDLISLIEDFADAHGIEEPLVVEW